MLQEKISAVLKEAMKQSNGFRVGVLRLLVSAVKNREIEKRGTGQAPTLTDEEILELVGREIKKRKEAAAIYEKGARPELAAKELEEIKELEIFLPPQLDEDEIKNIIQKAVTELKPSGPQDFGKIMGRVSKETKGRADQTKVSELVKNSLNFS